MNDRFVKFERSPMRYMIKQELEKGKKLTEITPEVSMITNLQNVKQGLKSDYDDGQIADFLLSNTTFTDLLIDEHLKKLTGTGEHKKDKTPAFVERDASCFRKFKTR